MPTTYLSYRLAQAHLPPPPSIPDAIPQLEVPSTRPFPSPQQPSEPLHPDHAISTSYNSQLNVIARLIHNGHALELRPLDLYSKKGSKSNEGGTPGSDILRILFPEALRTLSEGTLIFAEGDNKVYIIIVSVTNVLYRLSFPTGTFRPGKGARFTFTTPGGDDWCEAYQINEEVVIASGGIGPVEVIDPETIVLGCADGGIIQVNNSNDQWYAQHHRIASRFRLPSLFSASTPEDQVISLASYDDEDETLLYALSADGKLRVWNIGTGSLHKTIDTASAASDGKALVTYNNDGAASSSSSLPGIDASRIRIVPTPFSSSYSHTLVVFQSSPQASSSAGAFMVYRISRSKFGIGDLSFAGERACSASSAGAELRTFEIIPPSEVEAVDDGWKLWVSWDLGRTIFCESVTMDDLFQFTTYRPPVDPPYLLFEWQQAESLPSIDHMDAAYFDNILSIDPPDPTQPLENGDIAETFTHHLFYPGRFSRLTLLTALDDYMGNLPDVEGAPDLSTPYSTLSQRFAAVVGCTINIETNSQTGAPAIDTFRRDMKLEWLGVWATVRQLDKHARWPLNSVIMHGQVVFTCREGLLMPVVQDACGLIISTGIDEAEDLQDLPDHALSLYRSIAAQASRDQVLAISGAGSCLFAPLTERQTDDDIALCSDALTDALNEIVSSAAQLPVEMVAGQIWDDYLEAYLTEEDRTTARRVLSDCADLHAGLSTALDLLIDSDLTPLTSESEDSLRCSGTTTAMITSTLYGIIASRFTLARNVLLVAIFAVIERDLTADDEAGEELIELLSRAFALFHRYRVLQWLTEQNGEEAETHGQDGRKRKRKINSEDALLSQGFEGLNVRNGSDDTIDGYDASYSLLHSILARHTTTLVHRQPVHAVTDAALHYLRSTRLITSLVSDNEPMTADVKLAYTILVTGHPSSALDFTLLYPLSSGMAYIRGRAQLALGDIDEAARLLQLSSTGCQDEALKMILPPVKEEAALTGYYRHITALFEEYGLDKLVASFGQLTLDSAGVDDSGLKDVRTKVFLANLSLGLYEEAYTVLTNASDLELRKDFLGQLISHMCEANEIGRLNSLGFVGFQQEVEKLLAFKARHSDPLRFPNYYKVLYSWHVSRGDYRSAGEIMYLQARRLGGSNPAKSNISTFELAALQARSYLVAINCLSLTDKANAWVSVSAARGLPRRAVKRRRTTTFIPDSVYASDKGPVDLILLDDIKAEYTAVLSRLQLANATDAKGQPLKVLDEDHISVIPHEVVGMFVQQGMFDLALSSASTLEVDMSEIFVTLASRAVQLSRLSKLSTTSTDTASIAYLFSSPITNRLRGPPPALALKYLEVVLQRYDGGKTQWKYRKVVGDTLFELNQDKRNGWQMPLWLVDWELERDPEGWISRAIKWGWVEEAIDWSMEILKGANPPELLPFKKTNAAYTPFNLIDRVITAAAESPEKDDPRVQAKAKALKEAVDNRVAGLKRVK